MIILCSILHITFFILNILKHTLLNTRTPTKKRSYPPEFLQDSKLGRHGHIVLKKRGGLKIHYVAIGEKGKPLVLFLHGFPEFWYSWRYQLPVFGDDYYAVAINLPGYDDSSKPQEKESYNKFELAEDIKEATYELGYKSCYLVDHDWGANISYAVASTFPEVIKKLVIVNVPHPKSVKSFKVLSRFHYIFFFQLPVIPEYILASNDYGILHLMKKLSNEHYTQTDLEAYKYCFQNTLMHRLATSVNSGR